MKRVTEERGRHRLTIRMDEKEREKTFLRLFLLFMYYFFSICFNTEATLTIFFHLMPETRQVKFEVP